MKEKEKIMIQVVLVYSFSPKQTFDIDFASENAETFLPPNSLYVNIFDARESVPKRAILFQFYLMQADTNDKINW